MKSISARVLSGTSMGFLNLAVMMGQTILLVPILLHFWGGETYGIWLSVIALGMMFTTFDTGHQQYLLNRFNMRYPTEGAVGVQQDIADGLRMAMVLGGAQALIALILTLCGLSARVFGLELERGLISVANAAFLVFVLSWWIRGSVSGILAKLYVTRGDYTRSQLWAIWNQITRLGTITCCAVLGADVFITMIAFCLISMVNSAAMFVDIWKRYPDFIPWWSGGSFRRGFLNLRRSVVLTANGFLQQLSLSGLILLVGAILGAVVVPAFTTIRTVANLFAQATNIFLAPLAPDMSRFHVTGQKDKLGTTFAICWLINGITVNVAILLTLFFIEPLYGWWTQEKLGFSWPLYLSCTLSVSLINFGAPFVAYLKSINNLQALLLITVSRGVLVFGGAFVLLPLLGASGAGLALILGEVPASCLIPLVYCRDLVFSEVMLRSAVAAAINLIIMGATFVAISINGDWSYVFVSLALLCLAVSALVQWSVLPRVGKERLNQILVKVQYSAAKVFGRFKET